MELYCVDIREADETNALLSGRRRRPGSAFGISLLSYAVKAYWGDDALPEIYENEKGKPYFPERPDRHFSISHTRSHVLVAVSPYPVGADIETRATRPAEFIEKLTTQREREDFDFFDLWVLRESLYKLTGRGNLRKMRFSIESGAIVPPENGVSCRLYKDVPECAVAVSCFQGIFPESIIMVPITNICT